MKHWNAICKCKTNDSKPFQAKITYKFKESIRKAVKDQYMYKVKHVFEIELKEEPYWD